MPTMQEVADGYVTLRNTKKQITDRHKEELAPLNEQMETMEAWMLRELNEMGVDSVSSSNATAFKKVRTTVKTTDWDVFLQWVIDNKAYHFLTRKPVESICKEMLEEDGKLPPGVGSSSEVIVQVRAK